MQGPTLKPLEYLKCGVIKFKVVLISGKIVLEYG
jgi:hypothetical protein